MTRPEIDGEEERFATSMKVSIWMLPPTTVQRALKEQIAKHSSEHDGSIPFEPHVTVVGGIPCESLEQLDEWRCILKEGLYGVGAVPCSFRKKVHYVHDESESSSLIWNQACVCVMKRSTEFMDLIEKTRELMGLEGPWQFKPPLGEPHYSFFYGCSNPPPPNEIEIPPDFNASQVALWCTDPSSVEGVRSWKELAIFDLC